MSNAFNPDIGLRDGYNIRTEEEGEAVRILSFLGLLSLLALVLFVPAAESQGNQQTISIQNLAFWPAQLTVEPGTTIVWSNQDNISHTMTADDGTFDSGAVFPGEPFSFTFQRSGTVTYHCSIHPFMTASVTVSDSGEASTVPSKGPLTGGSSQALIAVALVLGAGVLGWAVLRRRF